jgi:hypothetical protein
MNRACMQDRDLSTSSRALDNIRPSWSGERIAKTQLVLVWRVMIHGLWVSRQCLGELNSI